MTSIHRRGGGWWRFKPDSRDFPELAVDLKVTSIKQPNLLSLQRLATVRAIDLSEYARALVKQSG